MAEKFPSFLHVFTHLYASAPNHADADALVDFLFMGPAHTPRHTLQEAHELVAHLRRLNATYGSEAVSDAIKSVTRIRESAPVILPSSVNEFVTGQRPEGTRDPRKLSVEQHLGLEDLVYFHAYDRSMNRKYTAVAVEELLKKVRNNETNRQGVPLDFNFVNHVESMVHCLEDKMGPGEKGSKESIRIPHGMLREAVEEFERHYQGSKPSPRASASKSRPRKKR